MAKTPTLDTAVRLTKDQETFGRFLEGYVVARGKDMMPKLQSYMLGEALPFLEEVTVLEVKAPDQIIYRLCGTWVADRLGIDMTGKNLLELTPEKFRGPMHRDIGAMIAHPCGNYSRYYNLYAGGRRVESESLSLPVRSDANPDYSFLLSLHRVEETAGGQKHSGQTQIGTDWTQSAFIDIGNGAPGETALSQIL